MNVTVNTAASSPVPGKTKLILALAWSAAGLPLLWGVLQTFKKALALFRI
jgi:hypothetical protein